MGRSEQIKVLGSFESVRRPDFVLGHACRLVGSMNILLAGLKISIALPVSNKF
jgi:hypothetical protein